MHPSSEHGDSTARARAPVRLAVLALLLLAGCAPPTTPLRLGTSVWPGYEPLYLARDLGYFNGVKLKLVEYPSASETLRAFRNGAIEAATLTLDEVLLMAAQGHAPRIVLVMDFSFGADALVAQPSVRTLAGLRGKRVGVENSALGAYVLTRVLDRARLKPADITVAPLEVYEHEQAFIARDVDAVVTFDPVRERLVKRGARVLFDSRQIPEEIVDVLAVRADYLAAHPDVVGRLLTGWFRALEYLKSNPDDAAARLGPRLELAPHEVLAAYERVKLLSRTDNARLLAGPKPALVANATRLMQVMTREKLLPKAVAIEPLLDPRAALKGAP
jgi:NitT/TauT family transport system substrate-binding protein